MVIDWQSRERGHLRINRKGHQWSLHLAFQKVEENDKNAENKRERGR